MSKISIGEKESPDRRRAPRAELLVRVDYTSVDELFTEFTRDINEGGLFIQTEKPPPLGSAVSMQFNLPGGSEPIETIGRVVRISTGGADGPPGMGVEFEDLGDRARVHIDRLVRNLRSGAPPRPEASVSPDEDD